MEIKYTYLKKIPDYPENYRLITINLPDTIVNMYLDGDVEEHKKMITFFDSSEESLQKYINYLAEDPNRNFNIDEILLIINN